MNRLEGDIPPARLSVLKAVRQFQTPQDFANLRPLLEGINYAGYPLEPVQRAKVVRLCGIHGQIYAAIECARTARTTGFKLDNSETINELLHFIQLRAIDDPRPATIAKSLRWARLVIDMLADDLHRPHRRGNERPVIGELYFDRDPQVLLARLHLVAALAKAGQPSSGASEVPEANAEAEPEVEARGPTAEDMLETTRDYALDIVRLWFEDLRLSHVQPAELYRHEEKMGYLLDNNKFVALATPLLRGLDVAIDVLSTAAGEGDADSDSDHRLVNRLLARRDNLAAEINEAREDIRERGNLGGQGRGEAVYQKLYGEGEGNTPDKVDGQDSGR